jgi:PPM family protein phosphatase
MERTALLVQTSVDLEAHALANAMTRPVSPEIECGGTSDTGPVREENEDAIRVPDGAWPAERGLLFGLADGMGGYLHGGLASKLALEALFKTFLDGERPLPPPKSLRKGVESANLTVYQAAQLRGGIRMGTTLTALALTGHTLHLAHVGDSRAYLVRDGKATCLTNDHTTVGELVRMKVLSPDKVRTHSQRSILNRAVGLGLFVQPDITEVKLKDDDRLILCSDGVWSVIQDAEFADLAQTAHGAQALSHTLIDVALKRETDDNVSAVTIHVRRLGSAPSVDTAAGHGWFASLRGYFHGNNK